MNRSKQNLKNPKHFWKEGKKENQPKNPRQQIIAMAAAKEDPAHRPRRSPSKDEKDDPAQRNRLQTPEDHVQKSFENNYPGTNSGNIRERRHGNMTPETKEKTQQHIPGETQTPKQLKGKEAEPVEVLQESQETAKSSNDLVQSKDSEHSKTASQLEETRNLASFPDPLPGESQNKASVSREIAASVPDEDPAPLSDEDEASQRASASKRHEGAARWVETSLLTANHDPHTAMDSSSSAAQQSLLVVALDESEDCINVTRMAMELASQADRNPLRQSVVANGVHGSEESQQHDAAVTVRPTFTCPQLADHAPTQVMVRGEVSDVESQGEEHLGAIDLNDQYVDLADSRDREEVVWPQEINAIGDLHFLGGGREMENLLQGGASWQPVLGQNRLMRMPGALILHSWITQQLFPSLTARDGRDRTVCFVETCGHDQHCIFLFNCHHTVCIQCFRGTIPRCPFCGQPVMYYFQLNQEEEEEIWVGRRGIT